MPAELVARYRAPAGQASEARHPATEPMVNFFNLSNNGYHHPLGLSTVRQKRGGVDMTLTQCAYLTCKGVYESRAGSLMRVRAI